MNVIDFFCLESSNTPTLLQSQTLQTCLQKEINTYDKQSLKYKERVQDLEDLLIDTGLPITFVDNKMFRRAYRRLDPKFVIPGMNRMTEIQLVFCFKVLFRSCSS